MKLQARVEKLEKAQGDVSQDMNGYDDRRDFEGHAWYLCDADGSVLCVSSFYDGHGRSNFASEQELWSVYPAGTKFLRSTTGRNYEVIDGVMRELHFPPSNGKLSPELQSMVDAVMSAAAE